MLTCSVLKVAAEFAAKEEEREKKKKSKGEKDKKGNDRKKKGKMKGKKGKGDTEVGPCLDKNVSLLHRNQ